MKEEHKDLDQISFTLTSQHHDHIIQRTTSSVLRPSIRVGKNTHSIKIRKTEKKWKTPRKELPRRIPPNTTCTEHNMISPKHSCCVLCCDSYSLVFSVKVGGTQPVILGTLSK